MVVVVERVKRFSFQIVKKKKKKLSTFHLSKKKKKKDFVDGPVAPASSQHELASWKSVRHCQIV
jgi:hypothetical protein